MRRRTIALLTVVCMYLSGLGFSVETQQPGDEILGTLITSGGASRVEVVREKSDMDKKVQTQARLYG